MPDWMVATHTQKYCLYTPPSNQEYIVKYVVARNLLCFNFGKPSPYANHDCIWCICHIVSLLEDFERFTKHFLISKCLRALFWIKAVNNSFLFNVRNSWIPIITWLYVFKTQKSATVNSSFRQRTILCCGLINQMSAQVHFTSIATDFIRCGWKTHSHKSIITNWSSNNKIKISKQKINQDNKMP